MCRKETNFDAVIQNGKVNFLHPKKLSSYLVNCKKDQVEMNPENEVMHF